MSNSLKTAVSSKESSCTGASVLVTGGAGFIGSHTCLQLLLSGTKVIIVDDLSNASEKAISRISELAEQSLKGSSQNLTFYQENLLNYKGLTKIFDQHTITDVIHFAGFKAVGESVEKPLEYYTNNITGTLNLCKAMREHKVNSIIFSSSATVYGDPDSLPLTEDAPKKNATNPYGWTKWMIEQILSDIHFADPSWKIILLRYFNPIGAHPSGKIGEDPKGIPNNLLPYVSQVAVGKLDHIRVYGNDYPTPDGTGIRDYIHVMDLAEGHVAALSWLHKQNQCLEVFNLGTGCGSSVLEIIKAFSCACGKDLPYSIEARRAGDIASNYASPEKAERILGWKARFTIDEMCRDSWRWQQNNPNGYRD